MTKDIDWEAEFKKMEEDLASKPKPPFCDTKEDTQVEPIHDPEDEVMNEIYMDHVIMGSPDYPPTEEVIKEYKEKIANRKPFTIMMTLERPSEEGHYFVQYHRNFQPVMCYVDWEKDELWLHTNSTSKPLKEVKAYCFSERL